MQDSKTRNIPLEHNVNVNVSLMYVSRSFSRMEEIHLHEDTHRLYSF